MIIKFGKGVEDLKDKLYYYKNPHKWFAWYPAYIDNNRFVIFQYVNRSYPHALIASGILTSNGGGIYKKSCTPFIRYGYPKYEVI